MLILAGGSSALLSLLIILIVVLCRLRRQGQSKSHTNRRFENQKGGMEGGILMEPEVIETKYNNNSNKHQSMPANMSTMNRHHLHHHHIHQNQLPTTNQGANGAVLLRTKSNNLAQYQGNRYRMSAEETVLLESNDILSTPINATNTKPAIRGPADGGGNSTLKAQLFEKISIV